MNVETEEDVLSGLISHLEGIFDEKIEIGEKKTSYPETILQVSSKGNKIFNSLQGRGRQFIENNNRGNRLFQWTHSSVENKSRQIVDDWAAEDISGDASGGTEIGNNRNMRNAKAASNALFSWSSVDSYIEAKKRELALRKSLQNMGTESGDIKKIDKSKEDKPKYKENKNNTKVFKESAVSRLNKVVDKEANRFIHARIQLIKAHHSEQMSKQIHERKRREHEIFLKKLKVKEEEYENSVRAATSGSNKHGGFFGSLFGFNSANHPSSEGSSISGRPVTEEGAKSIPTSSATSTKAKRFSFIPSAVPGINLWSAGSSTDVDTAKQSRSSGAEKGHEEAEDDVNQIDQSNEDAEKEDKEEGQGTDKTEVEDAPVVFNEADFDLLAGKASTSQQKPPTNSLI